MSSLNRIGFMQGRLSPPFGGCIQAFPWDCWQTEFPIAEKNSLGLMEWTLDQQRLHQNPLLTADGQREIVELSRSHGVLISSLTGDCFMQTPFWKAKGPAREQLQQDFLSIVHACSEVGISMIVVPLVDNGSLASRTEENQLFEILDNLVSTLYQNGVKVLFESDYQPQELARFIDRFDPTLFGVNYDIGNSAALGMNPSVEISAYGDRILNVHIKDRLLGGTTVPLGSGSADFEAVFSSLANIGYNGNYILQTARAHAGDHANVICNYRDMAANWISQYAA